MKCSYVYVIDSLVYMCFLEYIISYVIIAVTCVARDLLSTDGNN